MSHQLPVISGSGTPHNAQAHLGSSTPETGGIETIPLGAGSSPHGVIVGPEGAAWVTDTGLNAIVRVDGETFELSMFPLPGANANLNTAAIDPDGVVWFTGQGGRCRTS